MDARKEKFMKDENADTHQEINDEDDENHYRTPQIVIDQLFRLHKKGAIDEKTIRDQVNLMLLGGTDTSALTVSHALLMLAMNPTIQDRVVEEINQVFGDVPLSAGSCSTYEHVRQLIYTEQVLRETMRLFPVAPFLLRDCKADTPIRNCVIPATATVIVSVYNSHRNPDIWGANANEFDPDHFDADQMAARGQHTFLTFSRGPRDCLGIRYGMISMKIMMAAILRRYRFSTQLKMEDLTMKYEIIMKIVGGDVVKIEERYPDLVAK